MKILRNALLAGSALLVVPAHAQGVAEPEAEGANRANEIIVTAPRIEGSVETDVPPDLVLEPEDVASYGASTVTDLLDALSTQTRSGRGRGGGAPVVLVNGRRISGFSEIRDLPPEAIRRVETFPEEVALRYGFSADQRVVNFILKDDFRAVTGEVEYGSPTNWTRSEAELQATYLSIGKNGRFNLSADYDRDTAVLERERGVVNSIPGTEPFRTLLPDNDQFSLNAVLNRGLSAKTSATVNLKYDRGETAALFGLFGSDPLRRDGKTQAGSAGVTLNGDIGRWRWTGTANYDVETARTLTDRTTAPLNVRDRATSRLTTANTNWTVAGPVAQLPAGAATASFRAGYSKRNFRSRSDRGGTVTSARLGRGEMTTRASLDIPIASRNRGVLEPLGDLSVNVNGGYRRLSDFGGLKSYGYGFTWSPSKSFSIVASFAGEEAAPSQQQLSDPLVFTPSVTVYDFVRGESALVTQIAGGNPDLTGENRRDFKLGLSYEVPKVEGLRLSADYFRNRASNPLSSFPVLTSEVETAFAGRVVRDAGGRLVSIDTRAINYLSSRSEELRFGINFAKRIGGSQREGGPGMGARPPGGGRPPGARGPGGGGRGGGFGGGMFGGGDGKRVQAAVFYTRKLSDEIRIAPGLPVLDLLDGSATGAVGGTSRDRIEVEGGYFNKGIGFRLNANWQGGSFVKGGPISGGGTASDLRFSDLTTINLRAFINFDQRKKLVEDVPFLKGSRLSFRVGNLLNDIRTVRDGTGVTPLRYQPGYIDPLGRTFEISFRKLF